MNFLIKIVQLSRVKNLRFARRIGNIYFLHKYKKDYLKEWKEKCEELPQLYQKYDSDFRYCLRKHLINYQEYMNQFAFIDLDEKDRIEFMSQLKLRLLYNVIIPPKDGDIFWDKALFLEKFNNVIKRNWIDVHNSSYEEFSDFINKHDCIAKPKKSSCGNGVFRFSKENNEKDVKSQYEFLKHNDYILEELIRNEDSIAQFHPQSLNTIRIVTVRGKSGKINILGAFIRFGTGGNVVDNGGNDGILAQINCEKGEIMTEAFDKKGISYSKHPDTGIQFIGFKIPHFQEMIDISKAAAEIVPSVPITGWDIVLRNDGIIDIIEGNHRPDAYGLQTPLKQGYRTKLKEFLKS